MRYGCQTIRWRLGALLAMWVASIGALTAPASAIEFFEGDLQIHGFAETQMRVLANNYSWNDGYDLAQWYNIANVEFEYNGLSEGWGPFGHISAFVRVEARYDCVWTGGCYMLPGKETFGNQATRLPRRMSSGKKSGMIGVIRPDEFSDQRNSIQLAADQLGDEFGPGGLDVGESRKRHLGRLWNQPLIGLLFFTATGADGLLGTADDPGRYVAENFLDYRFGLKRLSGATGGNGTQTLGPYRPQDKIPSIVGALRDRANPLRAGDINPSTGTSGTGALPLRPAPLFAFDDVTAPAGAARGLFLPSKGLQRLLGTQRFSFAPDQNFSESALAWNHGASQKDERELKEAYIDLEVFDHHLWLRLGKQTIVWGKTELFRAQDQFNPQDLGLASLPSLEESRIALWSARGIWSFYDVGFLQDVRVEVAVNFDDFEPADVGRCGEPFSPRASCDRAFGLFAHHLVGAGLAGEFRPDDPWESINGVEWGERIEWRYKRASFAATHFYGYEDFPYAKPIFVFERNVDPQTGRLRRAGSSDRCDPLGRFGPMDDTGCLGVATPCNVATSEICYRTDNPFNVSDALRNHPQNQQLFQTICAATVGISPLSPGGCAFNIWNSTELAAPDPGSPMLSAAFSSMLAGQSSNTADLFLFSGKTILTLLGRFDTYAGAIVTSDLILNGNPVTCVPFPQCRFFSDEDDMPLVPLVQDNPFASPGPDEWLNDQRIDEDDWFAERMLANGVPITATELAWRATGISQYLTDQQEALLGCGRLLGTHCEVDGFDLFLTEASVFFQSWPGFEGTEGGIWLTNMVGPGIYQPGTVGYVGGPVCTRYAGGVIIKVPGCDDGTAPFDPQNNPQDLSRLPGGFVTPAFQQGHPFTGDPWSSELAALSWNALMVFVTLSLPAEDDDDGLVDGVNYPALAGDGLHDGFQLQGQEGRFDQFNPKDPYNPLRCSWVNPTICSSVAGLLALSSAGKKSIRAAGNSRFGRRDFVWAGGAEGALDYKRRHVFGIAMDMAEDVTRTNMNLELTWFSRVRLTDNASRSLTSKADLINLVIGLDRPTFIRFLNKNRTFFFNTQIFLQYVVGYENSFTSSGPFNVRATFSAFTGYHQDRLVPGLTTVYDFNSHSGAVLFSLLYRYTQNFVVQVGLNTFWGKQQSVEAPIVGIGGNAGGAGEGSQRAYIERGLSVVRDRDELFIRFRYQF